MLSVQFTPFVLSPFPFQQINKQPDQSSLYPKSYTTAHTHRAKKTHFLMSNPTTEGEFDVLCVVVSKIVFTTFSSQSTLMCFTHLIAIGLLVVRSKCSTDASRDQSWSRSFRNGRRKFTIYATFKRDTHECIMQIICWVSDICAVLRFDSKRKRHFCIQPIVESWRDWEMAMILYG